MLRNDRFEPNFERLLLLLLPATAYLVWASSFRVPDQVSIADGTIGVLLGLYMCSFPAANGIDLMYLGRGAVRDVASKWNGLGWLVLNMLVLVLGWLVMVVGTTQFAARSVG